MSATTSSSDPLLGREPALAGNAGARLSERDRTLLAHISRGLTDAQIAEELHLSPEALRGALRRVVEEMGARNRTHAVTLALRTGLIH
jgi:DNA-binding CsgD family transcriptional regulator